MKKYKKRPDVELLDICGEHLLVATGEARGICPYVTQINQSAADYWNFLNGEKSINQLTEKAAAYYGKDQKDVLLGALTFIGKMSQSNYLIEVETE